MIDVSRFAIKEPIQEPIEKPEPSPKEKRRKRKKEKKSKSGMNLSALEFLSLNEELISKKAAVKEHPANTPAERDFAK